MLNVDIKWIENDMKAVRTIVVAIAVMLFIVMICVGFRQIPYLLAKRDTYAIVYQLGYTDDKEIISWRRCTPSLALSAIFIPQCAVIIAYYPNINNAQIQTKINQLWSVTVSGSGPSNNLFEELGNKELIINNNTGWDAMRQDITFVGGPIWILKDKRNRTVEIHYYEIIQQSNNIYLLDGERVHKNIATVILWKSR